MLASTRPPSAAPGPCADETKIRYEGRGRDNGADRELQRLPQPRLRADELKVHEARGWEAEVKKMVSVMGAPVSEVDAAKLVDYLTREYGVAD